MTTEDKKQFYRDLINFFKYQIGINNVYGTLTNDSGILSRKVLMNDPKHQNVDMNLNVIKTRLTGEDYINVTTVWKDINNIIKIGKDHKFVEILTEILNDLEKENVKEIQ